MSSFPKSIRRAAYPARDTTIEILETLARHEDLTGIRFRLWDGSSWPDSGSASATIVLNRPSTLREMFAEGTEDGIGAAYIHSAFDIEGDFDTAFRFGDNLMSRTTGLTEKMRLVYQLHRLPAGPKDPADRIALLNGDRHTLQRDRDAIRFHYDVSNDFYRLWLDPWMAYSCAYFSTPEDDLATAQLNKFNHICRKLGLRRGGRLLDIGCGWGGLLIHAAKNYGVVGHGVTLSANQAKLARERVADAGLQDLIVIQLQDYRDIEAQERYDAIVSVGMVEHVGRDKLGHYFGHADALLKPGGLFMNHGISLGPVALPDTSGSFIDRYVFPDTDLLPIEKTLEAAGRVNFEIRDVECLREHYARTLAHWVENLENRRADALQHVTDEVYRIWRLYMAGCAYRFRKGQLSIYQTLLAKLHPDGTSRAPSTRSNWYAG